MTTETIAILGLIAFGLVFGALTARSSMRREAITANSSLAKVSHYLAASILCTVTPTVLVSIFVLHLGFIGAVSVAVVMFAIAFVLLLPYGILERPALDEKDGVAAPLPGAKGSAPPSSSESKSSIGDK